MAGGKMHIAKFGVTNYRSIEKEEFDLQLLSVLIGKNNSGKSNLLSAVRILLEGTSRDVSAEDFFDGSRDIVLEAQVESVEPYLDLCHEKHRTKIADCLVSGGQLRVRRTVSAGDATVGKLQMWNEDKGEYGLPTGIEPALKQILPEVISIEAFHDPTSEAVGKSSATLGKIIKQILETVADRVSGDLEIAHRKARSLLDIVEEEVDGKLVCQDHRTEELRSVERRIQDNLSAFFEAVSVRLRVNLPDTREIMATAHLELEEGGAWTSPELKGQGLQRALYVALLRSLADELRDRTETRVKRPFVLLVEEPEAFLHPSLLATMRDALGDIACSNQVVLATHSPAMIACDHLADAMLVRKIAESDRKGRTVCLKRKPEVFDSAKEKRLRELLSYQRSAKFLFANRVAVVEGVSDVVLFEAMTERLAGKPVDSLDRAFIDSGSKEIVSEFVELLTATGLKAVGIVDLDFLWQGAGRLLKSASYSSFRKRFCGKAKDSGATRVDRSGREVIETSKGLRLLRDDFADKVDEFAKQLAGDFGIYVLRHGEIEDYVGMSKTAKGKYTEVARKVREGDWEIQHVDEIRQILTDGLGISLGPT